MVRQIFLDTETTGLSADGGDRILELGCVEMVNRKLTGNDLRYYINPQRDSHPDALRVHGITTEFLQDKPKFSEIVETFLAYCKGAEIIIHNADFDVRFLDKELQLLGLSPFSQYVAGVTDTLAMAKARFPGKRNSLDALCERLGVDNTSRTLHGALLDAQLLADVYIHMTRGQEALLDEHAWHTHSSQTKVPKDGEHAIQRSDWSLVDLPVVLASEVELSEHEAVLVQIDKSSEGATLWRKCDLKERIG